MGDAIVYHKNLQFSTKDIDNDLHTRNCATTYGGWDRWFKDCYVTLLTGMKYETVDLTFKPASQWRYIYKEQDLKNVAIMFK